MSEASIINANASINNEEQEEKGVQLQLQPEQGNNGVLVNAFEDEEKPSTSSGNPSSRPPPQVQVNTVSHSREGKEDERLEKNRQKARDTRKRRKIMTGEMRRRIVSLQNANQDLQEKNAALQDALERALQARNDTSHQMLSRGPQMTNHNTDYNTSHEFSPRGNNNENILSRQTQQLIAQIEHRQRSDTENLMFPYGRPNSGG